MSSIEKENLKLIIRKFLDNESIKDIEDDQDLKEIGLDSLTFINIILNLEDLYKIEIPEEKLIIENLNTINKIYEIINEIK